MNAPEDHVARMIEAELMTLAARIDNWGNTLPSHIPAEHAATVRGQLRRVAVYLRLHGKRLTKGAAK